MARERMRPMTGPRRASQLRWIVILAVLVAILVTALAVLSVYFGLNQQKCMAESPVEDGLPGDFNSPDDHLHHNHPTDVRLPRDVLPLHYTVRLLPFFGDGSNFTTNGHVRIVVECASNTSKIILHSADSVIDHKSVKVGSSLESQSCLRCTGTKIATLSPFKRKKMILI